MLNGPVIHLDETKINILGADQYVWVLTDNSRVIFRLRRTRETDFLKALLTDYKGTVVSDFYGGYDALPCRQQKCLVHLIRDLNDDLWKNPFDDEFERFIVAVRDLLSPILEDVKRFGLKARHLRKHKHRVDSFYREAVTAQVSAGDTTARYRKRFERYKESLFSFIENDNVPLRGTTTLRRARFVTWLSSGRSLARLARKAPVNTSACSASRKPVVFNRSLCSAFSSRDLQTSTDTEKGAGRIRTGWLTAGTGTKITLSEKDFVPLLN